MKKVAAKKKKQQEQQQEQYSRLPTVSTSSTTAPGQHYAHNDFMLGQNLPVAIPTSTATATVAGFPSTMTTSAIIQSIALSLVKRTIPTTTPAAAAAAVAKTTTPAAAAALATTTPATTAVARTTPAAAGVGTTAAGAAAASVYKCLALLISENGLTHAQVAGGCIQLQQQQHQSLYGNNSVSGRSAGGASIKTTDGSRQTSVYTTTATAKVMPRSAVRASSPKARVGYLRLQNVANTRLCRHLQYTSHRRLYSTLTSGYGVVRTAGGGKSTALGTGTGTGNVTGMGSIKSFNCNNMNNNLVGIINTTNCMIVTTTAPILVVPSTRVAISAIDSVLPSMVVTNTNILPGIHQSLIVKSASSYDVSSVASASALTTPSTLETSNSKSSAVNRNRTDSRPICFVRSKQDADAIANENMQKAALGIVSPVSPTTLATLPPSTITSATLVTSEPSSKICDTNSILDETDAATKGLCGLRNIGNTCFMNSVIQCLSHTMDLTKFFRAYHYSRAARATNDQKILYEFAKLIQEMWSGDVNSATPTKLKRAFSAQHLIFGTLNQQDAQEFLRLFVDSLHSALKNELKNEPLHIDDNLSDNEKADLEWERYIRQENSFIRELFVGQLKSTLMCTTCGNTSVTFDPFWDLSVSLPSRSRCNLNECILLLTREEVLDGDEMPTCVKCQTRRTCTKNFTIQRLPTFLIIHIKRYFGIGYRKIESIVEFPTGERELNMGPYSANRNSSVQYSLYAVINHKGSIDSGHYVALCKHPVSRKWHEFNDNSVSDPIDESNLVSPDACILFYEKV